MVFNTTFNNILALYCGGQFCLWRKPEYPEKPPTCGKSLANFKMRKMFPFMQGSMKITYLKKNLCKILMLQQLVNFLVAMKLLSDFLYQVHIYLHNTRKLYSQPQVIKFTSFLPMVGGSLRVLQLLPPLKLVAMI